ncbi:helix-turn-helix transcriptional regulator [Actinomycetospora straminea]|uniref:LuxR family transcriptional regulator n=1 Tax=Actinomycetospora straminea TaxID=663607 RepID=A0ABP9DYL1_9PSEU|nr:LuxR family transcriptional regulator [Actinomycetospora straminea]MDD7932341.1 AAA family ATPase [Actinomycetospora straminea]
MPGQGGSDAGGTAAAPWRAADAAVLARCWDRARTEGALTVVLTGDAGAGKTRLVRGLADRAEADGGVVVAGAAVDVGEQLPLWPVATGLRRLLRAPDDAPPPVLAARAALTPWRDELAPLLEPGPGTTLPSGGHLLELVRRVLVAIAAEVPVLVVVDDLHWADRTTRELVVSLVAHLADERILLVATARSEALDAAHPLRRMLPELTRDRAVRAIALTPLPRAVVTDIVRADGGDAALSELVWRRSGGNPFIIAETLAAVADGAADGLSPGLRGLVLGRLSALRPLAQTVVAALALGEEPVPHRLLAEVVRTDDEDDLLAALREAAEAAMVVVDPEVDGYALRHGLMRDVVAGELMPGERRGLHRRYALAYEAVLGDGREPDPDHGPAVTLRRAHHWARADDPERALPAVVHAATVAEQMHEFGTAYRQWMAALALVAARAVPPAARVLPGHRPPALPPADADAGDLLARAADTARLAGEYDVAVDLLQRLVPDPAAAGAAELPAVVRLGRSLLDAGRTGDAVAVLHDAGRAAGRVGDDPALAAVHAAHAEALLITGDVRGARREAERALAVSRREGELAEQAPMLATLGFALAYLENPDAGLAAVADGLMIAERSGDAAAVGRAYQSWADLLSGPLGELHEGVEIARQGVARMRDLGLARSAGVRLLATAANGLFRLGRWSEASDAVDEAWALSPTGADALEVRLARCRLQVGRGEFVEADEDLRAVDLLALDGTGEEAGDLLGPSGSDVDVLDARAAAPPRRRTVASRYRVPLLTLRAGVEMWRGRPDLARALVARGLDVAEHTPDDVFLVAPLVWHGLRAEAEAAAHGMTTDRAALDRLARHVAHLERRIPHTVPALRRVVLAYVRMCHAETGRAAGASDPVAWGQVAEMWSAQLNRYPAAYALLRRAEALLDTGERRGEAARALRAAAATASEMGAGPFLDEIAGLARRARLDIAHAGEAAVTTAPGAGDGGVAPELAALTSREHEVLAVLADGLSNREIAHRLYISERTVAVHVSRVLAKTGTRSRTQAAALLQRVRARPTGSERGHRG